MTNPVPEIVCEAETFCDIEHEFATQTNSRLDIQIPPSGRLTATNLPSLVDLSSNWNLSNPTTNENIIIQRLERIEQALERFQHAVGHSLMAIDNDLCRLETRLSFLEKVKGRSDHRPSASSSITENLLNFNCSGTFSYSALAVAALGTKFIFIATSAGTIEVWGDIASKEPQHMQTLFLTDMIRSIDDSLLMPASSIVARSMVAFGSNRLIVGLSNGRLAVFKVGTGEAALDVRQLWPEQNFFSSGLELGHDSINTRSRNPSQSSNASVNSLALSRDHVFLAFSRENELTILGLTNQGIHSAVFIHSFVTEIEEQDVECETNNRLMTPETAKIHALEFDEDSNLLFVAVGYRCIAVFTKLCLETHITWRRSRDLSIPFDLGDIFITSLIVVAGNRLILAGASNGKLYVFERATAQHYRRASPASTYTFAYALLGHTAAITSIAAIGSTSYPACVFTASADATIQVLHHSSRDREMHPASVLEGPLGHKSEVTKIIAVWDENEISKCRLFSASLDGTVKVWVPSASIRKSFANSSCPDCCDNGSNCSEYVDGE